MKTFQLEVIAERWNHANAYCLEAGRRVLIDPGLKPAEAEEFKPDILIATHVHFDHLNQIRAWQNLSRASFYCPAADRALLADEEANCSRLFCQAATYPEADHYLQDGDRLHLSESFELRVIATPGHTPGSSCYLLEELLEGAKQPRLLFSGDCFFANSIGRCDLPFGNSETMHQSLQRLKTLLQAFPSDLTILPGHGPACTAADILNTNPYFCRPLSSFVAF